MAHVYGSTSVSGGRVIQGNYHETHYHRLETETFEQRSTKLLEWLSDLNFATNLRTHCNKRTPGTGQWLLKHSAFQKWKTNGAVDAGRSTEDLSQEPLDVEKWRRDLIDFQPPGKNRMSPLMDEWLRVNYPKRTNEDTDTDSLSDGDFDLPPNKTKDANRILWCRGIPGVGKTVLCSTVIEHLRRSSGPENTLLYCYFDYARRQELTADRILANLLRQLYSANLSRSSESLEALYKACEEGRRLPTYSELQGSFSSACKGIQRISIVIDALDECEHIIRRRLFHAFKLTNNENVYVFVTSRPHVHMNTYTSSLPVTEIDVQIPPSDLTIFVESRIADAEDTALLAMGNDIELPEEIAFNLLSKDNPRKLTFLSFLGAEIYLNSIQHALTAAELSHALNTDLSDLPKLYDEGFQRIQAQSQSKARLGLMALRWLSRVKEPISVDELAHALCITDHPDDFSLEQVPLQATVLSACMGLANLNSETDVVRLLHYTVQEYLDQKHSTLLTDQAVLQACLKYMTVSRTLSHSADRFPFLSYALRNWHNHVTSELQSSDMLLQFMGDPVSFEFWLNGSAKLRSGNRTFGVEMDVELFESILNVAKDFGLSHLTTQLHGLAVALWQKWEPTTKSLLKQFSNLSPETLSSLLHVAIEANFLTGVELLLDTGADATSRHLPPHNGTSPIYHAVSKCHLDLIPSLLKHGADIKWIDGDFRTLLHVLLDSETDAYAVDQLLRFGVAVNGVDKDGRSPLHQAITMNQPVNVIRCLLNNGASVSLKDRYGMTPLHVALGIQKDEVIVDLLLQHGAPLTVPDDVGDLPLHYAVACYWPCDLIEKFLAGGHGINAQNSAGLTALHIACTFCTWRGAYAVTALLLKYGSDVNLRARDGDTSLHIAVDAATMYQERGYTEWAGRALDNVMLLLEHGASAAVLNAAGRTPMRPARKTQAVSDIVASVRERARVAGISFEDGVTVGSDKHSCVSTCNQDDPLAVCDSCAKLGDG